MKTHVVRIAPRDPLIARDGRPFGADSGQRMRSLDWLLPSVAAGSLRTLVGKQLGGDFADQSLIDELKALCCRGPLLVSDEQLFVPAPHDVLIGASSTPLCLRPIGACGEGAGCDLPAGLRPVLAATDESLSKARMSPAWWSMSKMVEWLLTKRDMAEDGKFFADHAQFRTGPARDERTHLQIDPKTLASEEGMLFSTTGLVVDRMTHGDEAHQSDAALVMSASHADTSRVKLAWGRLPTLQSIGGERRLAEFRTEVGDAAMWRCPTEMKQALNKLKPGSKLRLVLASPAVFAGGWRPGWLNDSTQRSGTPPGLRSGDLKLKLVAVANQRWEAVSGWAYDTKPPGPKKIRRLVPAGGVYFFEVESISNVNWDDLWLMPISDDKTDRDDGFGLALWGLWNERQW